MRSGLISSFFFLATERIHANLGRGIVVLFRGYNSVLDIFLGHRVYLRMALELIWYILSVYLHSFDKHSTLPGKFLTLLYFIVSELESHSLEVGLV
jgi:hypothetical protein